MRDFKLSFTAGETKDINVPGNCVHVVNADNPISIELDESGQTSRFERDTGAVIKPGNYGALRLTSSTAQNVTVCLGFGESYYTADTTLGDLTVGEETPDILTPLNDVSIATETSTLIVSASPGRKEVRITLSIDAKKPLRIGNNSVSATKGGLLYPGTTEYLTTNAAVFGFNTDADNAALVSVLSVEKA